MNVVYFEGGAKVQKKILVVSLNPAVDKIMFLPTFSVGGINRVATGDVVVSAGGKGVNVARMCAQYGMPVASVGFAAGDAGKFIALDLESHRAEVDYIWLNGETRTNLNIISENSETEILEEGPSVETDSFEKMRAKFQEHLKITSVAVFAGGLPRGVEADAYKELIELAKREGVPTILDTSGEALIQGLKAGPDMVKPNLRELTLLLGNANPSESEIIDKTRILMCEFGVKLFVISRGAKGAVMISDDVEISLPAVETEIVNTIGCGDALVAGLACGLAKGLSNLEILKLGMEFAASNAGHKEIGYIDNNLGIIDNKLNLH